ncbi:MAG: hypothetical protein N2651_00120 [Fimbriimonadales bacterium]|nr:hypothetical protein [Fimbriimonadales bacterium]
MVEWGGEYMVKNPVFLPIIGRQDCGLSVPLKHLSSAGRRCYKRTGGDARATKAWLERLAPA